MAGKFNYEKRHKYPHLLGDDVFAWNRFIDLHSDFFDTVDYDIHVGSGISSNEISPDKGPDQYRNLTKKRIDVIGWKGYHPTIVEVKKRVGLDTLGQVLGYEFFYRKEHPEIITLPLLVICLFIGQDDLEVLEHFHISVMNVS